MECDAGRTQDHPAGLWRSIPPLHTVVYQYTAFCKDKSGISLGTKDQFGDEQHHIAEGKGESPCLSGEHASLGSSELSENRQSGGLEEVYHWVGANCHC